MACIYSEHYSNLMPPEFVFASYDWHNRIEIDYWMLGTLIYEVFYEEPLVPNNLPIQYKLIYLFKKLGKPSLDQMPYCNTDAYEKLKY